MSHRNPITLALANAKDLIKSTAAALMSGAVIPKSDLMQNLTLLVEILTTAQSEANKLTEREVDHSIITANVREYAVELLFSLDEKQTAYKPRSHGDNIELVHELLELVDGKEQGDE
ncbi:MAG: hypothetical protein IPP76_13185 [Moraxellaceae bacterium]|jgi:uncharacterized Rossmann fold enzyme|nr:hypothetical protein [Moraxellaceae bacterium]MBK8325938.1 hypothetical protein [Moraxellaceae bacterium]MBK9187099.1 hypothetical protein [Moraxellaceae bacterium]MBL0231675.1 hypothetical protein [Moraxellaceae bacterium]